METKEVLKLLRKSKGFTNMKDFCEAVDISINTYQNYESGKRIPTADILVKLADFYGVTTDYLLGREPEKNPIAMLNLAIGEKEALEMYVKLPEEVRQIIIDTMIKLGEVAKNAKCPGNEISNADAEAITNKDIESMTYPVKTAARRGINGEYDPITTEYLTAEEILDIINAEDADDDL